MIKSTRDLEQVIRSEFRALDFARDAFPMLTAWGVEDFSVTIHSLGCNYLSALGRQLGFWAISEYPVRVTKNGKGQSIRPDIVWWSKPETEVILLGEFERFDPHQKHKLMNKAKNLLQAHHEIGEQPRILLLMTWTMAGTDMSSLDEARTIGHNGFCNADGFVVPGLGPECAFIVAAAVFGSVNGIHRLQRIHL